ncbi:MAG: SDR family NAD(P)-dependent oxidoreductase [Mycobacteriaceae bacterium]
MTGSNRRSAIVTGAASGIGAAIATRLARDGIDVLGVDLQAADVGGAAHWVSADLTTRDGNRLAVETALERFGRLDVIVANAGFQHVAPVPQFPEDTWDRLIALLLTSPFLLARYGWPSLLDAPDGGRFVVVASAHALVASPFKSGYVAAKHGVLGLVKTLALEGADHGVTASAICPGYVRTPLVEQQIAAQAAAHGLSEDEVLNDVILAAQPVKRLIEAAEVAEVASLIIGPHGRSFTGAPVIMDNGWTAR